MISIMYVPMTCMVLEICDEIHNVGPGEEWPNRILFMTARFRIW